MVSVVLVGVGFIFIEMMLTIFAADMEKCGKWGFYDDTIQQPDSACELNYFLNMCAKSNNRPTN